MDIFVLPALFLVDNWAPNSSWVIGTRVLRTDDMPTTLKGVLILRFVWGTGCDLIMGHCVIVSVQEVLFRSVPIIRPLAYLE